MLLSARPSQISSLSLRYIMSMYLGTTRSQKKVPTCHKYGSLAMGFPCRFELVSLQILLALPQQSRLLLSAQSTSCTSYVKANDGVAAGRGKKYKMCQVDPSRVSLCQIFAFCTAFLCANAGVAGLWEIAQAGQNAWHSIYSSNFEGRVLITNSIKFC
jgi:hypothetical protein